DPASDLAERIVYFEFDRSDIPSQHLETLDAHARYLVEHPDVSIRLEGHADERGSREYNIGLGDRRAQAVRRILLFQGVANDQVKTVSYGEERPAVEGHNEEAYAQNRRVEIIYIR
ncbi:MAG TPA: peptidoglycan-associated lipoprotein Pal, partial [Gammaproteobacteria bacterium]